MVEVTEADKVLLRALDIPASASDLLVVAMHREAAAKAERDRIVAWLRSDGPDRDNGGPCRHVEHSQGTCICNELADALESQP